MNSDAYFMIFRELGFHDIELRKKLKHRRGVPTVYFNRQLGGKVYFAIMAKERDMFRDNLWVFIDACQKKDDKPNIRTVVPKIGKERLAFADIIGK